MASMRQAGKMGEYLVKNTDTGRQVSGAAVVGVIGVAKVVGLGALATAAAPVVVPGLIAAAIGSWIWNSTKQKKS